MESIEKSDIIALSKSMFRLVGIHNVMHSVMHNVVHSICGIHVYFFC